MVHITTEEGQWTTKIAVEAARIVAQNLQRVLNTTKES